MDQYFFVTPFATLGDQTSIPIPVDAGGQVSMSQGWGPDYQRDQASDPLAKPIDRGTMNWMLNQITTAIRALQTTGTPEWISPANNNGTAFAYAKYARARYSATVPATTFETYISVVDNNTSVPGADNNWQPVAAITAANADIVAGTSTRLIVTPAGLLAYPGNNAQTFKVATATQPTHAVPLAQAQGMRASYAGVQSLNATATLTTAIIGEYVKWTGAAGTLTLPSVAALNAVGLTQPSITFKNNGSGVLTLSTAGSGDVFQLAGSAQASLTLQPGDDIEFALPGTANIIDCVSGSALRQFNPLVVGAATSATHAAQLGQVSGVVGSVRNLLMSVPAASASATMTADEIIVETALGGLRYCLANFNKTINLATTGAGGMDTGSAPASGFVALYAIYNPTTQTAALLATNATGSTRVPEVYAGGFMPAGYTASALVSVYPTNSSRQLIQSVQIDRLVGVPNIAALTTSTPSLSVTALSVSSIIPANARFVYGNTAAQNGAAANTQLSIYGASFGGFAINNFVNIGVTNGIASAFAKLPVTVAQTIYYNTNNPGGTPGWSINLTAYEF